MNKYNKKFTYNFIKKIGEERNEEKVYGNTARKFDRF